MLRLSVTTIVLVLTTLASAKTETIYTLIIKGHLEAARDSLSRQASAATRDGNMLFYQSLLEPDAEQAVRLMEAALNATLQSRHREEITYRLAQYCLLRGDYRRLARLVAEYQSRWEVGRYAGAMRRLSILVDELQRGYESALRQCDRFLVKYTGRDDQDWGLIDKARILRSHGKRIGANETLRQLSRGRKGVGVPQALFLLGRDAISRDRADDAIFYYNILREGYPSAIGLDDLVTGLGGMSTRTTPNNRAEKLTGTFYSVKVGVFSEPGNARRQADRFKGYDKRVEIKKRKISGRNYRVVYVGRFEDYEAALQFRLQLEATHREAYQVVAR